MRELGLKKVVYWEGKRERVVRGETIELDDGFIEVNVDGRQFLINKNRVVVIKDLPMPT